MSVKPKADLAKNDDSSQKELEDIMSEIESLQRDMSRATEKLSTDSKKPPLKVVEKPTEAVTETDPTLDVGSTDVGVSDDVSMEDFQGSAGDASLEETLAGMKEEPTSGPTIFDQADTQDTDEATSDPSSEEISFDSEIESEGKTVDEMDYDSGSEGSLTMNLSGQMKLKLKYEYNGQEVTVGFSGEYLRIELSDGTEFKIPVRKQGAKLKAA